MSSIGLSFADAAGDRPRSLTSAVQERLRADILSTRLAPRPEAPYRRPRQTVFRQSRRGARGAVAAGRRRPGAGLRPARLSRQPGVACRSRDVTRTRIDIEGLALRRSIERGDQAWLGCGRAVLAALGAVPYTYPDDPACIMSNGWCATASSTARWSMPAARHGCSVFATCCTSRASAIAGFRSAATPQIPRRRGRTCRDRAAVLRRDADAAVAALAKHFLTTMRFVELAASRIAEVQATV